MPRITYIDHDGNERPIVAVSGETVMETAIRNSVPGIDADCGGACACATCHVYVDEAFLGKLDAPGEMEKSMLDFAENIRPNSRLSCQISLNEALDGMRVTTPENQR